MNSFICGTSSGYLYNAYWVFYFQIVVEESLPVMPAMALGACHHCMHSRTR